jgi:transposase
MDLTDAQWEAIEGFVPREERQGSGRNGGRPFASPRAILDGVLWILRTGAPWADLPRRYPPPQTCHRRFQRWVEGGVLDAGAKRGALWLGELDVAKRPRSWQWQTATVFQSPAGLRVVNELSASSSSTPSITVS